MSPVNTDGMAATLRSEGHRVTRPRRAVWSALQEAQDHLTAEELVRLVQRREPGVNIASVYRALALFAELDMVRESRMVGEESSRWELAHPDEHFHLVCDGCGRIDHHIGSLVQGVRDHLADGHEFEPRSVELIVTGRCGTCTS